jgi:hypothetical protein
VSDNMTLIEAAAALGKSYNQVLRLVLTRQLKGDRRDGRWFCDRGDVVRLSRIVVKAEPASAS